MVFLRVSSSSNTSSGTLESQTPKEAGHVQIQRKLSPMIATSKSSQNYSSTDSKGKFCSLLLAKSASTSNAASVNNYQQQRNSSANCNNGTSTENNCCRPFSSRPSTSYSIFSSAVGATTKLSKTTAAKTAKSSSPVPPSQFQLNRSISRTIVNRPRLNNQQQSKENNCKYSINNTIQNLLEINGIGISRNKLNTYTSSYCRGKAAAAFPLNRHKSGSSLTNGNTTANISFCSTSHQVVKSSLLSPALSSSIQSSSFSREFSPIKEIFGDFQRSLSGFAEQQQFASSSSSSSCGAMKRPLFPRSKFLRRAQQLRRVRERTPTATPIGFGQQKEEEGDEEKEDGTKDSEEEEEDKDEFYTDEEEWEDEEYSEEEEMEGDNKEEDCGKQSAAETSAEEENGMPMMKDDKGNGLKESMETNPSIDSNNFNGSLLTKQNNDGSKEYSGQEKQFNCTDLLANKEMAKRVELRPEIRIERLSEEEEEDVDEEAETSAEDEEEREDESSMEEESERDTRQSSISTVGWNARGDSRSRSTSLSRSTTSVTFCLPTPNGAELPPLCSRTRHSPSPTFSYQYFSCSSTSHINGPNGVGFSAKCVRRPRDKSPVERLVVDEVHFTFRIIKTDGNGSPGRAEEEDRSPRWRNDENGEALLARKREQHKRDSSPSAHQHSSRLDNQQNGYQNQYNQKQQSLAGRTTNQIQQQNGYIPNGAEAKLQLQQKETKPSSVSAVIWERSSAAECVFSPLVKLALPGSREKETENEEHQNKPDSHLVEPPSYQQAAADSFESTLATAIKLSRISGKLAGMPKFHFPLGRPVTKAENDQRLSRIRELFEGKPRGQLHLANFGELCQRIDFPIYTKRAVYDACCQLNGLPLMPALATVEGGTEGPEPAEGQPVDFNQFCVYWNRMISEAHDEAARFVFTLSASAGRVSAGKQSHCPFLLKEDFLPMLMDLILTHPGLHFLKEAPQFYSKYCEVVIIRIFWNINRSWTGKINASELRRSNFLQTLRVLDDVGDINKVTEYFSYEHFYVTYCKFWELDTDHDMVISREDMRRHCNGALTDRIIDRIFSAAVIRTPSEQRIISKPGPVRTQQPIETIGFEDFVAFLLAEEDKRHPTSIEYWFRCVDLDGDGQISLFEMEYFYHAIEQKLLSKNMETLALRDVICNLLDSISPENGFAVSRTDLKRSGLSHRFFNTFVNWIKYVDQESSDGERAAVKTTGDKEISDWEVFCLTEYELLMSETEQMSNEGDVEENIDVILDDEEEEQQLMSGGTGVTAATSGSLSPSLGAIDGEQRLNGFLQQKQNAVVSKAM